MIKIENISKSYGSGGKTVFALRDVRFSIEKGDIYGIIGLSGAGKSTLIRCLAGLAQPSSGAILFDGTDIARFGEAQLRKFRKKIGMIFQHFNLLSSRTAQGNIAYPLEIAGVAGEVQKKRIEELLHLVDLIEKRNAYPSRLSGGEKQRVGIARALANHPEILFCDEATSALDPKTTKGILALLKKLNRKLGLTIVLITHEMEVIKSICNKVAVIDKGAIVEEGEVVKIFGEPKHPITKNFLETSSHAIPERFFKDLSSTRQLLRLTFRGEAAGRPLISRMIKTFDVDANILLGYLDNLQTAILGTLVIELTGPVESLQKAIHFLEENSVGCEVVKR